MGDSPHRRTAGRAAARHCRPPWCAAAAGPGSLRAALAAAPPGATLTFFAHAFPAGTTIALAAPLEVRVPVTIQGPAGAAVTLEGRGVEVFRKAPDTAPVVVTLAGVALRYP